jgi:hypothetical protein
VALYEQERELAGGTVADGAGKAFEGKAGERVAIDRSRVVAPLMTLSAYFSRSGALAFKRLTSLSTFEAFVLSGNRDVATDRLGEPGSGAGARPQPGGGEPSPR